MILYLASAGVHYEGSGVLGIFTTLNEAKAFDEKQCEEHGYGEYCDNYYYILEWNTDTQSATNHWDWNKETRQWELWEK